MRDLLPIPAPLADLVAKNEALQRAADRLGLDLNDRSHWDRIGAEAGIQPPAPAVISETA